MSAVATPSSWGSSVRGQDNPPVFTFDAGQDETNQLAVSQGAIGHLVFQDSVALTAGEGCVQLSANSARCRAYDGHGDGDVNISLGDNDDSASVSVRSIANVYAGKGQDTVSADSFGGTTYLYGEEGNDTVTAGGEGGQIADGGSGNDLVRASVPCGTAGGATGRGGPGDDTVLFTNCGVFQTSTTLDGGSGADLLVADPVHSSGTVAGGDGNDIVRINTREFNNGPFHIWGGSGDDTLRGGGGADTVSGDDGNDYLDTQGGGADVATCGAGLDIVLYDASDTVSDDCEIRSKDGHLAWLPPASGTQSFGLFGSLGPRWR